MKTLLTLATITLLSLVSFSQSVEETWETYDDETGELESTVKIHKKNGKVYGKIIGVHKVVDGETNPICNLCPDERKNKSVVRMNIITDLSKYGLE